MNMTATLDKVKQLELEAPWEAQIDWAPDKTRDCTVFDYDRKVLASDLTAQQAYLIAAAPELYVALRTLMEDYHDIGRAFPLEAIAALRKATLGE